MPINPSENPEEEYAQVAASLSQSYGHPVTYDSACGCYVSDSKQNVPQSQISAVSSAQIPYSVRQNIISELNRKFGNNYSFS